jgi:preprotein translocase subunit SecE
MARTRQKAKQRKAKRLEQERKASERSRPGDGADAATTDALAEVEQAQRDAAEELSDAQQDEVGAGREAARSAAAVEAAAGAEALTTGEARVSEPDGGVAAKPTRRERRERRARLEAEQRRKAAEKPERRKPEPRKKPARPERKEARQRGRVINFFIQVWAELRRVQWPTRSQVTQATAVVIVFCVIAGGYLGIWDYVFNKLIKAFL